MYATFSDKKHQEAQESLVLPAYRCANKSVFLCDLIAFVFYIKGQCPSFKEVEKEVKLLVPPTEKLNKDKEQKPISKVGNGLYLTTTMSVTPAKVLLPSCAASSASAMFTCFTSPVECKFQSRNCKTTNEVNSALFTCYTSPIECKGRSQPANIKVPLLALSSKQPLCEFVHTKDELHMSFVNDTFDSISVNISIGFSQTFDSLLTSAKKSLAMQCTTQSPILHIKRNVHQERMLRCLAEVVPAVLHAAPHSDAIMLAFGPSLLNLDQAVLLEFANADGEDADASELDDRHDDNDKENDSDDEDSDDNLEASAARRQRQLVFSQLLGVSGFADAIPLTSMHVLLRLPRSRPTSSSSNTTAPPPPFRPRPHFRLRPACRLTRLTLPCGRSAAAAATQSSQDKTGLAGQLSTADSIWYHSATPVPGYALPELG